MQVRATDFLIGVAAIPIALFAMAIVGVVTLAGINWLTTRRPGASEHLIALLDSFGKLALVFATAVAIVIWRQRAGPPDVAEAAQRSVDRRSSGGRQTEATATTAAKRRRRRRRN